MSVGVGIYWARVRDQWSDKPYGRRSHAFRVGWGSGHAPYCGVMAVSVDATLKSGKRCAPCLKALKAQGLS